MDPKQQIESLEQTIRVMEAQIVDRDKEIVRVKADYQRSENERGSEKRVFQWVVETMAEQLKG